MKITTLVYHNPVLAQEAVAQLLTHPDGVYLDATFGGGGHSRILLSHLNENGRLLAVDQDPDAKRNLPADNRLTFFPCNFRDIDMALSSAGISQVDGLLADLGVSSHQFDTPERGFSFRFEAPLNMRMDAE